MNACTSIPTAETILGVMAKTAQPGRVKTRLAATIGDQAASKIHQCFLNHVFRELAPCGDQRHWVASPPEDLLSLRLNPPPHWQIIDQGDGDLGDRMRRWFVQHAFRKPDDTPPHDTTIECPRTRAVLIGSDCPTLVPADIQAAYTHLMNHDIVLGPATDGGYYLIGLSGHGYNRRWDALWHDIPWSTSQVHSQTVAIAEAAGWRIAQLPTRSDIDTDADLTELLTTVDHPLHDELQKILAETIEPGP